LIIHTSFSPTCYLLQKTSETDNRINTATSWNGYGMASGTVTLHSWADGAEEDDAKPPMGCNYDARLDPLIEYDHARDAAAGLPPRHGGDLTGGSVSSRVVQRRAERRRAAAQDDSSDEDESEGGIW
jgi:hypothetical protein